MSPLICSASSHSRSGLLDSNTRKLSSLFDRLSKEEHRDRQLRGLEKEPTRNLKGTTIQPIRILVLLSLAYTWVLADGRNQPAFYIGIVRPDTYTPS